MRRRRSNKRHHRCECPCAQRQITVSDDSFFVLRAGPDVSSVTAFSTSASFQLSVRPGVVLLVRYRFKGIVRASGQTVEGHAHGETPDDALAALSEHGIVTESLREDPEPLNMSTQSQPLSSAIDSALDTASQQVPFDEVAKRYTGKNVWVLDRDKIRKRVAQVVDQALRDSLGDSGQFGALNVSDLRKQVADAIGGLFKDNRNLTSQFSNTSMQMDHQVKRIEMMVHR